VLFVHRPRVRSFAWLYASVFVFQNVASHTIWSDIGFRAAWTAATITGSMVSVLYQPSSSPTDTAKKPRSMPPAGPTSYSMRGDTLGSGNLAPDSRCKAAAGSCQREVGQRGSSAGDFRGLSGLLLGVPGIARADVGSRPLPQTRQDPSEQRPILKDKHSGALSHSKSPYLDSGGTDNLAAARPAGNRQSGRGSAPQAV
jgi:hypothetical protein